MKKVFLPIVLAFGTFPAFGQSASAVYPQQEGFVDAHGVMIYYLALGSGSPLVVVHGGPGADHTYFLPYLLPLARTAWDADWSTPEEDEAWRDL